MCIRDSTYIRLAHGFVYLTAVMDWASRYVLSWEVSVTMVDDFCVNPLKTTLRRHKTPEIFNTDQGAQYTGKAFTGGLKDHGVQISMDGKGRCMDNIFIECFSISLMRHWSCLTPQKSRRKNNIMG